MSVPEASTFIDSLDSFLTPLSLSLSLSLSLFLCLMSAINICRLQRLLQHSVDLLRRAARAVPGEGTLRGLQVFTSSLPALVILEGTFISNGLLIGTWFSNSGRLVTKHTTTAFHCLHCAPLAVSLRLRFDYIKYSTPYWHLDTSEPLASSNEPTENLACSSSENLIQY